MFGGARGVALNTMGNALVKYGRFAEAAEFYQRALNQQRQRPSHPRTHATLTNFAHALLKMGHIEHAENLLSSSVQLQRDMALRRETPVTAELIVMSTSRNILAMVRESFSELQLVCGALFSAWQVFTSTQDHNEPDEA